MLQWCYNGVNTPYVSLLLSTAQPCLSPAPIPVGTVNLQPPVEPGVCLALLRRQLKSSAGAYLPSLGLHLLLIVAYSVSTNQVTALNSLKATLVCFLTLLNSFLAHLQYKRHHLPLSMPLDCFPSKPYPLHPQSLQMTIVLSSDPPLPHLDLPWLHSGARALYVFRSQYDIPQFTPFHLQMRMGTQTLIQALQVLPWIDSDNDDEVSNQEQNAVESENEDEASHRGTHDLHHIIPSLHFP